MSDLHGLTQLGQATIYPDAPCVSLLQAIPRELTRQTIQVPTPLPFFGVDIWTHYEVSWLNLRGMPEVAIAEISIPANSPNLLESKSLKLYFNGFNQAVFASPSEFIARVRDELSAVTGSEVGLRCMPVTDFFVGQLPGQLLDNIEVACSVYQPDVELLEVEHGGVVSQHWHTHLFRSNCPVTNQPDWASVVIQTLGPRIVPASLIRYLVSFRQHAGFHEQCVERIFMDLHRHGQQQEITVYARYTRRGGLDINPYRSNVTTADVLPRTARQ